MKTTLTFILTVAIASLYGQTATITLTKLNYDIPSRIDIGVAQPVFALLEPSNNLMEGLQIRFEDQNESLKGMSGDNATRPRVLETQIETWTIRDNENLTLDMSERPLSSSPEDDNILYLNSSHSIVEIIEVYDVLGRVVHSSDFDTMEKRIPMDHLMDGIYYLVLRDGNKEPLYTQKLALK